MTCCSTPAVRHKTSGLITFTKARPMSVRAAWKELHRIADKYQPRVRRAFLTALEEIKGETKLVDIAAALQTGRVEVVVKILGLDQLETRLKTLTEELRGTYEEAAKGPGIASLPTIAAAYRFDLMNPHSVNFLQNYNFRLVKDISNNTREALRTILVESFKHGVPPAAAARRIRDVIGLTPKMARAVVNYERSFDETDMDIPTVSRLVESYITRLTRARANTISRTETIRAAGAGREGAWQDAAEKGFIKKREVRREWLVTDDDRLCPICEAIPGLNEGGVGIDQPFQTDVGPKMQEPAHPNCRCSVVLTYPEELQLQEAA